MRRSFVTLIAIMLIAALSVPASAQDMLKYLPADHDVVVSIDLNGVINMMPEKERMEMMQKSNKALGFDITERIHRAMFSLKMNDMDGDTPSFIGLFQADISLNDIKTAAAQDGAELMEENIAGFTALYSPEEEGDERMYFAQAANNLYVVGNKNSLETFSAVKSGSVANATTNQALTSIIADMDAASIFSMVGVFSEEMREQMGQAMPMFGDLTNFVFNFGPVEQGYAYEGLIGAANEQSLNLMKGMIDQYIPMMKNQDASGMMGSVLDNFNYEVKNGRLVLNGLILQATIDELTNQFAPLMNMDDEWEENEEEF